MNEQDYRRAEARLDEAMAIFAEKEAQVSAFMRGIEENVAKVRADVAALRRQLPLQIGLKGANAGDVERAHRIAGKSDAAVAVFNADDSKTKSEDLESKVQLELLSSELKELVPVEVKTPPAGAVGTSGP